MQSVAHPLVRRIRACIAGACFLALSVGAAIAQEPAKVRVLVATKDTQQTLRVDFITKGAVARGLFLPFGNIGNAIAFDARSKEYSATIGPFDRRPTLVAAIEKAFESKYPVFDVIDDGATYENDKGGQSLIERARSQGMGYVLLVDEQSAGITSGGIASPTHDVSVGMMIRYELYETAKGNRLAKDRISGNSFSRIPLEQALADRGFLEANMPAVHEALAKLIVGGLVRTDQLHRMAASVGQGAAVPAVGAVLKRHESRLSITMTPPKDWRSAKTGTGYMIVVEPKGELRYKMGVRAEVDLLIPEFGQDVETVEEYQQVIFPRLNELGFDPATAQARTDFGKQGYSALSVKNPATGGGQFMLFRKIDDQHISIISIVALDDFEERLVANKAAFQAVIDSVNTVIK